MFSEVFIPEGLQARFLEVRIPKELASRDACLVDLRRRAWLRSLGVVTCNIRIR